MWRTEVDSSPHYLGAARRMHRGKEPGCTVLCHDKGCADRIAKPRATRCRHLRLGRDVRQITITVPLDCPMPVRSPYINLETDSPEGRKPRLDGECEIHEAGAEHRMFDFHWQVDFISRFLILTQRLC